MKNLIIISAPSGAGKTTLCRALQEKFKEINWSISTQQEKLEKWKKMVRITILLQRDFKKRIDQSFAEWEKVHGFYYGTSKNTIEEIIKNDEMLLLEMDVKIALAIKKLYPNKTYSIFVSPPDIGHLRKRLQKRGTDSKYRINIRLQRFKEEINILVN